MEYGVIRFQIEELMKERGVDRKQLCSDLGITGSQLKRYCNNQNTQMDAVFLCKLCDYFRVGPGDLMRYSPGK